MAPLLAIALSYAAFDQAHTALTALLRRFVHAGEVDYAGLKTSEGDLDSYLRQLVSVRPEEFERFDRNQQFAFRINAYNAYAIRMILDHYPVSSIRKIGLLPGAAFRSSFIPLLGGTWSLNGR